MLPYHLNISNETDLYRLDKDKFQMTSDGSVEPIMIGYKYVLFDSDIADYIAPLEIQRVKYTPAIIWNRKTGVEYRKYTQLIVSHHFDSVQINDIDLDGMRFLIMDNRYLLQVHP